MKQVFCTLSLAAASVGFAGVASAVPVYVSFTTDISLNESTSPVAIVEEDVLLFESNSPGSNTDGDVSVFIDGITTFDASGEDIDAFDVFGGSSYLSTTGAASIGGTGFGSNEVVSLTGGTASVELSIGGSGNLDALSVTSDGFYFSFTTDQASLTINGEVEGGVLEEDVVFYDPSLPAGSRISLAFDGSAIFDSSTEDIDGFDVIGDNLFLISALTGFDIDGTGFSDGDIVQIAYDPSDPTQSVASLFLSEDEFDAGFADDDLDALALIPEPASLAILAAGLGLAATRRRSA